MSGEGGDEKEGGRDMCSQRARQRRDMRFRPSCPFCRSAVVSWGLGMVSATEATPRSQPLVQNWRDAKPASENPLQCPSAVLIGCAPWGL